LIPLDKRVILQTKYQKILGTLKFKSHSNLFKQEDIVDMKNPTIEKIEAIGYLCMSDCITLEYEESAEEEVPMGETVPLYPFKLYVRHVRVAEDDELAPDILDTIK
jgi:hypothetical protein